MIKPAGQLLLDIDADLRQQGICPVCGGSKDHRNPKKRISGDWRACRRCRRVVCVRCRAHWKCCHDLQDQREAWKRGQATKGQSVSSSQESER